MLFATNRDLITAIMFQKSEKSFCCWFEMSVEVEEKIDGGRNYSYNDVNKTSKLDFEKF